MSAPEQSMNAGTKEKDNPWLSPNLDGLLRAPLLTAYIIIGICFVGMGLWASTAKISSAVVASGLISPEGSRKTVQHLEGGIIANILVEDGDRVKAGEILVELEETQARASFVILQNRKWLLESTITRLRAEQSKVETYSYPQWMLDEAEADDELQEILDAQLDLFLSRKELYEGRKNIGNARIARIEEEIGGFQAQITSQDRQLNLIEEELIGKKTLLDDGLFPLHEYLPLQRLEASIEGDLAVNEANIARSRQSIGENEMEIANIESERLDRLAAEFAETRSELDSVDQQLGAREDTLTRTIVRAPVDGIVTQLRFHTTGGVVKPGEPILDLVPSETQLLIDARINPIDIDELDDELEVRVVFSAFSSRNLPQISGTILSVSADSIVDEATGLGYFLVRIEIAAEELEKLGEDIEITPGMPAEVYIVTGERTMLQYLFRPLVDSLRRSFRES